MNKIIEDIHPSDIKVYSDESSGIIINEDFIFARLINWNNRSLLRLNQPYTTNTGGIMHIIKGDAILLSIL